MANHFSGSHVNTIALQNKLITLCFGRYFEKRRKILSSIYEHTFMYKNHLYNAYPDVEASRASYHYKSLPEELHESFEPYHQMFSETDEEFRICKRWIGHAISRCRIDGYLTSVFPEELIGPHPSRSPLDAYGPFPESIQALIDDPAREILLNRLVFDQME